MAAAHSRKFDVRGIIRLLVLHRMDSMVGLLFYIAIAVGMMYFGADIVTTYTNDSTKDQSQMLQAMALGDISKLK